MAEKNADQACTVLAVDDNEDALYPLMKMLEMNGYNVIGATSGNEALQKAEAEYPDVILLDLMMPDITGFEVAQKLKADDVMRYTPIILLTANDSLDDIVKGLAHGADDYITKPFEKDELLARLKAVMRMRDLYRDLKSARELNKSLQDLAERDYGFNNIIGGSSALREVFQLIDKVKNSDVPILVTGESGTGKELVAKAIHYNSQRKNRSFIIQNCSALNDQLLESELFGHVKGSFTGAVRDKQGLFEAADGGTFFLDELGEMSTALQVKLLRVLQDGTFTPVGGTVTKKVNVRVVAATNRDLLKMVEEGTFREDLYYRLCVVNIQLPPLRDRRVDIPALVDHFLKMSVERQGLEEKAITKETILVLTDYEWPGNIRQLQNEVERLILMAGNEPEITADLISPHILAGSHSVEEGGSAKEDSSNLKDAIEKLERRMIREALERLDWNKSEAARELGISRSSLISKVQLYKLEGSSDS